VGETNTARHYYVTEGLFGEQPIWRVVRGETNARGMEMLSFVCGCATRRGALSMARAMSEYRECQDTQIAVRPRDGSGRAGRAVAPAQHAEGIQIKPMC
jgi:hypothetical protein